MTTNAEWLAALLDEHQPSRVVQRTKTVPAKAPGQIWRALAMDRNEHSALVLVLNTEFENETHHNAVVLLTADLELTGSRDYVLPGQMTGTGYDLAVQTELTADVWEVQLDRHLGNVSNEQLEHVAEMVRDRDATPEGVVLGGPPIVNGEDPRWNFKRAELVRLQRLSNECVRQLIDGEEVPLLPDPHSLRVSDDFDENLDLVEYASTLLDLVAEDRADLPVWLVERLYGDPAAVVALRAEGFYDVVLALVARAVTRLGDDDPQLVPLKPDDLSIVGASGFDAMRHMLLAQTRASGATCVKLLVRHSDVGRHDHLSRTYVSEQLMQCVTTDHSHLVSRTH